MSHYCICPKCKERFDRDKVQAVKIGARRYGHASCFPENKDFIPLQTNIENSEEYKKLMDYIKTLYQDKANYPLIRKQIKQYIEEYNYSISGMMKSLMYFYQVKNNPIDKSNGGIGIIPFCYTQAYNYYYNIYIASQVAGTGTYNSSKCQKIEIDAPQKKVVPPKLFSLDMEDENEE